jgi:hypothetical protein
MDVCFGNRGLGHILCAQAVQEGMDQLGDLSLKAAKI